MEDLKVWFDLNQKQGTPNPYFSIYRGPDQNPSKMVFRNETENNSETAWSMLEEVLEMQTHQGGLFRVYITDKPKGNVGLHTLFKIANPYGNPMQSAINGAPGMGLGMYSSVKDYVQAEVAKERQLWDLKQEIEDMRREQESNIGETQQLMQEFMPVLKNLAQAFGMKMMGYGPQPSAPPPAMHMNGMPAPDDTEPADGYDYERIEPALDQIRTVFPDTETTLEKIAKWARSNPDMAKQVLQNLDA